MGNNDEEYNRDNPGVDVNVLLQKWKEKRKGRMRKMRIEC